MLAMVLVAAAPAFAQTAVDDSVATADNSSTVEYNAICQNVIGSITTGDAAQYGDATAGAADDSAAVAEIAAELDTSVDVVNECLNAEGVVISGDDGDDGAAAASASASASASSSSGSATLPDTGGASLITLGAGALLVAGGLIARRIVR